MLFLMLDQRFKNLKLLFSFIRQKQAISMVKQCDK